MGEDVSYPAVSSKGDGAGDVIRLASPEVHFHAIRVQQLFWRFIAPPVVNRRRSHHCASMCRFDNADSL